LSVTARSATRSRAAAGRCVSARRSASQKAVSIPTSCSRVHPPTRASRLSVPPSRSLLWPRRRSGTCFVMVTPSSTARAALGPSALGAVRLFPRETTISKVFADRSLADVQRFGDPYHHSLPLARIPNFIRSGGDANRGYPAYICDVPQNSFKCTRRPLKGRAAANHDREVSNDPKK
jgi:hypothetical protein